MCRARFLRLTLALHAMAGEDAAAGIVRPHVVHLFLERAARELPYVAYQAEPGVLTAAATGALVAPRHVEHEFVSAGAPETLAIPSRQRSVRLTEQYLVRNAPSCRLPPHCRSGKYRIRGHRCEVTTATVAPVRTGVAKQPRFSGRPLFSHSSGLGPRRDEQAAIYAVGSVGAASASTNAADSATQPNTSSVSHSVASWLLRAIWWPTGSAVQSASSTHW